MSAPAVLIASAKLLPGQDQAFSAWQARHNAIIDKFPGFISSDVIPPTQPDGNEWTIVLNFRSEGDLAAWQRSNQRAGLVGELVPLLEGGSLGESAQLDRAGGDESSLALSSGGCLSRWILATPGDGLAQRTDPTSNAAALVKLLRSLESLALLTANC